MVRFLRSSLLVFVVGASIGFVAMQVHRLAAYTTKLPGPLTKLPPVLVGMLIGAVALWFCWVVFMSRRELTPAFGAIGLLIALTMWTGARSLLGRQQVELNNKFLLPLIVTTLVLALWEWLPVRPRRSHVDVIPHPERTDTREYYVAQRWWYAQSYIKGAMSAETLRQLVETNPVEPEIKYPPVPEHPTVFELIDGLGQGAISVDGFLARAEEFRRDARYRKGVE